MKVIFVIVCAILLQVATTLFHRCPNSNNLSKYCTCNKTETVWITCQQVKTSNEMERILKSFQAYVMDYLTIKKSGPFNFTSTVFRRLYIHNLSFKEVDFNTFNMFYSLQGLEFTLEELHFINCNVFSWLWTTGLNFVYLKTVHFENTTLPKTLTNDIMKAFPTNIRSLHIIACSIKKLGNKALRKLAHLKYLDLERNHLTVLKRSMFPEPARRLKYISLNKNRIRNLPENFFWQMRRLEFLFLAETLLKLLPEEIFHPIWEQLEQVSFKNIELLCDCKIVWLLTKMHDKTIEFPTCKSLFGNKDRPLNYYSYKSICS